MRIALFSDVHGNAVELAAVLEAIQQESPDVVAFLGDAVLRVPMPAGTIALLRSIPHIAVRGNYDWIFTGNFPNKGKRFEVEPFLPTEIAWVREQLTTEEITYLEQLPMTVHLFQGTPQEIALCHASPGRCFGGLFKVDSHYKPMSDEQVLALLEGESAPLIACGHTHSCMDRTVGRYRIINAGSVSLGWNPQDVTDDRAWWVLMDWQHQGWQIRFRSVSYDHRRVWQAYQEWELWPLMQEYTKPRGWGKAVQKWALRQTAEVT
ncbi:MAG: metallophosphoesterase family protein [Limnochordia bacterium]